MKNDSYDMYQNAGQQWVLGHIKHTQHIKHIQHIKQCQSWTAPMIFIKKKKKVTDRPTDRPTDRQTDRRTDTPSYRDGWTHLKMGKPRSPVENIIRLFSGQEY